MTLSLALIACGRGVPIAKSETLGPPKAAIEPSPDPFAVPPEARIEVRRSPTQDCAGYSFTVDGSGQVLLETREGTSTWTIDPPSFRREWTALYGVDWGVLGAHAVECDVRDTHVAVEIHAHGQTHRARLFTTCGTRRLLAYSAEVATVDLVEYAVGITRERPCGH